MKLKVRSLKNEEAEIEVMSSDTISQVKEKVQEKFPSMDAAMQKLIHSGRILSDEQTVADYVTIKENDRLVVMVTKPTGASKTSDANSSSAASSNSASPSTNVSSASPAPASSSNETAASSLTSASSVPSASPSPASQSTATNTSTTAVDSSATSRTAEGYDSAASALLTGSVLEETINNIALMGFERSQIQNAMRAAFNNPDRAVEYLTTGIPSHLSDGGQAANAAGGATPGGGAGSDSEGAAHEMGVVSSGAEEEDSATVGGSANPLEALRQHPMFNQIRTMLQSNPSVLPQVLELIGQSNAQLLQLINENPDAFVEMLQEPVVGGGAAGGGGMGRGAAGGGMVQLTREEMDAVQRLEGLGFPRHAVVEAYIACDRNEEVAANYLFENSNEFLAEAAGEGEESH